MCVRVEVCLCVCVCVCTHVCMCTWAVVRVRRGVPRDLKVISCSPAVRCRASGQRNTSVSSRNDTCEERLRFGLQEHIAQERPLPRTTIGP